MDNGRVTQDNPWVLEGQPMHHGKVIQIRWAVRGGIAKMLTQGDGLALAVGLGQLESISCCSSLVWTLAWPHWRR